MANFGFVKVAAAIPSVKVADTEYNSGRIAELLLRGAEEGASLVAFPELSLTGYTCGDLFAQTLLLDGAQDSLCTLLSLTASCPVIGVVGLPLEAGGCLYNTAVVFYRGKIMGVVPKSYLPDYDEFYEGRWFSSGMECPLGEVSLCGQTVPFGTDLLFEAPGLTFGVEICEDLWVPVPPSCELALAGATLLVNLSASDELAGKHDYLRALVEQQSGRTLSAYLYVSAGFGESTTDVVMSGNGMIAENGEMLAEAERFMLREQLVTMEIDTERLHALRRRKGSFGTGISHFIRKGSIRRVPVPLSPREAGEAGTFIRRVDPMPFVPMGEGSEVRCAEVFDIQVFGLAQRLVHTGVRSVVLGVSGGLDSTLALLVAVGAFDKLGIPREGITAITMPGFGTTDRTYKNALELMRSLGVTLREIPIGDSCRQHFIDIGLEEDDRSVTYENAQARERTQILMDVANMTGGLVVGTGDLSELALGWATYNGDQMSMYGVNAGVPKTLVRRLVNWWAGKQEDGMVKSLLLDIIDTPISPELIPAEEGNEPGQKTEDLVGPYPLHDFYLYYFLRYGFRPSKIYFLAQKAFAGQYTDGEIKHWMKVFFRRFFAQQFKRSAMPDGPKVGSVGLSPRGDWRMPSDASAALWLSDVEKL